MANQMVTCFNNNHQNDNDNKQVKESLITSLIYVQTGGLAENKSGQCKMTTYLENIQRMELRGERLT